MSKLIKKIMEYGKNLGRDASVERSFYSRSDDLVANHFDSFLDREIENAFGRTAWMQERWNW